MGERDRRRGAYRRPSRRGPRLRPPDRGARRRPRQLRLGRSWSRADRRASSRRVKTLVVGGDGRAHALAWRLAQSGSVEEVVAAPGNPGIARMGMECVPVDPLDPAAVSALADDLDVDLTVVSPEAPLVAGVVDAVQARGRPAFGPTAEAARLEG